MTGYDLTSLDNRHPCTACSQPHDAAPDSWTLQVSVLAVFVVALAVVALPVQWSASDAQARADHV